jgi:SAM-dependent methyltransferase
MEESASVLPLPATYGDRIGRLRANICSESKVLEIGGSYNPVAPRRAGYNTFTVDHATRDELLTKYKDNKGVVEIETVDFVCWDGNLDSVVGSEHHGTFDVCVASHVIEHQPNPVRLLRNVEMLLTPTGVFTLAIPDKRCCFDFFRPLTNTAHWLEAYERAMRVHSPVGRFEFEAYTVGHDGVVAWNPGQLNRFHFASSGLAQAYEALKQAGKAEGSEYHDIHAWTFVPSSFALIILELHALGVTGFVPTRLHTGGWEFFVDLRKEARTGINDENRLTLLKRIAREQMEGLSQIVG